MTRKLDQILVVDVESKCWDGPPPEGEESEIIEIGLCVVERVCSVAGVGYPFGITHLNVKSLFAVSHGLKHEVGLDGAYDMLNLPMEGTHHRGDDDAWNIAGILCRLLGAARATKP